MKNSTKVLYFHVAVLATLSLTNHVMAMEPKQDEEETARRALPYIKSSKTSSSSSNNEEPLVKAQPNPKFGQSSQRKRFDPPAELSHEDLKSIFEAPFQSTSPFLHRYEEDLQKRDELRGQSYTERRKALNTNDHDFLLTTGVGENSARVLLQDKSAFASLKETRIGRDRVGGLLPKGNFLAMLNDIETRSISTMGEDYNSVFGVYNLYDATTEKPVTYIHEVSQKERPVTFRIAFSQEKEK